MTGPDSPDPGAGNRAKSADEGTTQILARLDELAVHTARNSHTGADRIIARVEELTAGRARDNTDDNARLLTRLDQLETAAAPHVEDPGTPTEAALALDRDWPAHTPDRPDPVSHQGTPPDPMPPRRGGKNEAGVAGPPTSSVMHFASPDTGVARGVERYGCCGLTMPCHLLAKTPALVAAKVGGGSGDRLWRQLAGGGGRPVRAGPAAHVRV